MQVSQVLPSLTGRLATLETQRGLEHWKTCIGLLTPEQRAVSLVQALPWLPDPILIIEGLEGHV